MSSNYQAVPEKKIPTQDIEMTDVVPINDSRHASAANSDSPTLKKTLSSALGFSKPGLPKKIKPMLTTPQLSDLFSRLDKVRGCLN